MWNESRNSYTSNREFTVIKANARVLFAIRRLRKIANVKCALRTLLFPGSSMQEKFGAVTSVPVSLTKICKKNLASAEISRNLTLAN